MLSLKNDENVLMVDDDDENKWNLMKCSELVMILLGRRKSHIVCPATLGVMITRFG